MSPIVKKKKEKLKIPSKYVLLGLTILCIIIMFITFMTNYLRGPLNAITGYIVVPFQRGISEVGSYLTQKSDELLVLKDVLKENAELKEQISELTSENILLQQDKYELENLRKLLELDKDYLEYEKTAARIISKDTGNWYSSFVIDKGSNDNIEIDMNIIADGGLVGRVTEVGPNWARVLSIIDDTSNVSAYVLTTNDNLFVSGNLSLMLENKIGFSMLINRNDTVAVGDKIVTSNISEKFLPGILIGYITDIKTDANNLSKSGYIKPVVDFEHLSEVLVIMQKKQSIE